MMKKKTRIKDIKCKGRNKGRKKGMKERKKERGKQCFQHVLFISTVI